MAEFRMPSLGADMDEGTLVSWLVGVGDHVERGQVVAEVDTEKSVIEVETFDTGTVAELLVEEGERVPVGTPLAVIAEGAEAGRTGPAPDGTTAARARPPRRARSPRRRPARAGPPGRGPLRRSPPSPARQPRGRRSRRGLSPGPPARGRARGGPGQRSRAPARAEL